MEFRSMILMIDNYDSFTFNLVRYCHELGANVSVYRNDQISLEEIERLAPQKIILSPGPKTPVEAGICLQLIEKFYKKIPILGVCLGHQCIAYHFGTKIIKTHTIRHGKTVAIHHTQTGIFKSSKTPFKATLYNSLIVDAGSIADCLNITAWTVNETGQFDEIMGLQHKQFALFGVQFHPEAILTEQGHDLLRSFLEI